MTFQKGFCSYITLCGGDITLTTYESAQITIQNNAFSKNTAYYGDEAVYVESYNSSTINFINNTFSENANGWYGGIYLVTYDSSNINLINNAFSNNNVIGRIASLASHSSGAITISNNTFSDNTSYLSGGVWIESWSIGLTSITNNIFSDNTASGDWGTALTVGSAGEIILSNNNFWRNNCFSCNGAAYLGTYGNISLINNIFSENIGGGVSAQINSGNFELTNNTFSQNTSLFGGGAFFYQFNDMSTLNIYNNIFWDNNASFANDLFISKAQEATVNLFNNDFSGNADFITGQSEDLYVNPTDKYSHGSNLQVDPLFVDAGNGDFHLMTNSPLINKGSNSAPSLPLTDFEGDTRIINGTVDIGADEIGVYSISGHIKSKGLPLSEVTVSLTGDKTATSTTDINGYYCFSVENGEYFINATKENYYFRSKPKKVKIKGKNDKVNFKGN